jgi:hypothetical protein
METQCYKDTDICSRYLGASKLGQFPGTHQRSCFGKGAEVNVEGLQAQGESRILPGLTTELLVEALRLGIFEGDAAVIRFILEGNRC